MLNVGLVTASTIPSPRARPCTNVVFPTPRFPCNARTVSAGNARPNSAASARVSSGDDVVTPARNVSSRVIGQHFQLSALPFDESAEPGFLPLSPTSAQMFIAVKLSKRDCIQGDTACGDKLADARETHTGECSAPLARKSFPIRVLIQGKQEFVILSVAQGRPQVCAFAKRDTLSLQGRRRAAWSNRVQIFRQPVAHVHHGPHVWLGCKPRALGEPGRKREMVSARTAVPKRSCNINPITTHRANARENPGSSGFAQKREAGRDDSISLCDVTTHNVHMITPRRLG